MQVSLVPNLTFVLLFLEKPNIESRPGIPYERKKCVLCEVGGLLEDKKTGDHNLLSAMTVILLIRPQTLSQHSDLALKQNWLVT